MTYNFIVAVEKSQPSGLPLAYAPRHISSFAFWLISLAIWGLSFLTQQDFYFSVEASSATAEQVADAVAEGSLLRRLALPMMAFLGVLCLIRYRRQRLNINGLVGWSLVAFFLWMIASILWSTDPDLTGRRLFAYACLMICAFGFTTIAFERLPQFVTMFCGLNLALGVLAEIVLGTFHPGMAEYRFGGAVHPNLQGVNISLLILALSSFLGENTGTQRRLAAVGLVCAGFFLLLTQSRTSLGALCLTLLLIFSIKAIREHGLGSLALPITVLSLLGSLLLIVGILIPEASSSHLATGVITTQRDSGDPTSLTGRVDVWETLIDYAAQRPILGFGHDAFWSSAHIEEVSSIDQWLINQAHNSYLELLLNLGVVGLCLYTFTLVGAWLICLRRFFNGIKSYWFASGVLLFAILHGCLESIDVLPIFSNFLSFLVLFHIGYIWEPSENE